MTTQCPRSIPRCAAHLLAVVLPLTAAVAQAQAGAAGELPAGVSSAMLLRPSPICEGPSGPGGLTSGIWASGPDYKVSFHDGMTFYPYVGAARQHQPVHWRTVSVRAGDDELAVATDVAPRYAGQRCEYDLGAVVERYEVRADGLEQSFVFERRPASGDLIVTGELTGPLSLASANAQHVDVALSAGDGEQIAAYGKAFAIDAAGAVTPVTTRTIGNRIELRVDADTVATATFPLVIDPLIASSLEAIGNEFEEVDLLHETLTDPAEQARMWFTFTMTFAQGDRDVHLWRVDSDFGGSATEVFREISTWDATHGRLALAPAASRVVMVYGQDAGVLAYVAVHSHHTTDNHLTTGVEILPLTPSIESDWRPDVGGRWQASGGSKVLITCQREPVSPLSNSANSTVVATVFDASVFPQSNAFVVPPFVVLPRPNAEQERPCVNQSAASNNWVVAFQEMNKNISNDDWDITTVAIDGSGTVVETGLDTAEAADPLVHSITPGISGSGGRYLLTYVTREFELPNPQPNGRKGNAVSAQRLDWNHGAGTGSLPHPVVPLLSLTNNVLENGGSAFDNVSDSHWCVGLSSDAPSRYRVHKLGYSGKIVEAEPIPLQAGFEPSSIGITFQVEDRRFPLMWVENDPTGPVGEIFATMMEYVTTAPPTLLGFACGSGVWGGLTETADHQAIGTQRMPLRLTNAPVDTVALLFVSMGELNLPADALGAPGCILVPDIVTTAYMGAVTATITGGNALVTLDLPEFLVPTDLVMQWIYLVPGANALGLQASEGLSVQIRR